MIKVVIVIFIQVKYNPFQRHALVAMLTSAAHFRIDDYKESTSANSMQNEQELYSLEEKI